METIFSPIRFKTHIQLTPRECTSNFEERILTKIKTSMEGICTRYGYIRPNSLNILKRSVGILMKPHFNGHIRFDVICKAHICNPVQGMVIEAIVRNKNELGLYAETIMELDGVQVPIMDIIVPSKSAGITSELDVMKYNTGDVIFVEVVGKTFKHKDTKISIIGRLVKNPNVISKVNINDEDIPDIIEEENEEGYIVEMDDFDIDAVSSIADEDAPIKEIDIVEVESEMSEEEDDDEEGFEDDDEDLGSDDGGGDDDSFAGDDEP